MGAAKNGLRLTEIRLIRFTKEDMQLIKKLAKEKRLQVAPFIRMIVGEYITKESEKEE